MADVPGINKRSDGSWEMDTAAFLPEPQGYVKIKNQEYPIYSFLDLPVEDSMKVVTLHERIAGDIEYDERLRLSIAHLIMLSAGPDEGRGNRKSLAEADLKGLTGRQIVSLVVLANSIAAVPQKGTDEKLNDSASPVPVLAGSTDGVTKL